MDTQSKKKTIYKSWNDMPVIVPLSVVADLFQVDVRAVYKWIETGQIKGIQMGKKWYFQKEEIKNLFRNRS